MSERASGEALVIGGGPVIGGHLQMLSPMLIGFVTPIIAVGVIDPVGVRHARLLFIVLLLSALMLASLLFLLTLVWPGDLSSVVIDGTARTVAFVHRGLLADMAIETPFDQIASIGVEHRFDPDGYPFTQAEIRLRDGQRVPLPPGTTTASITAARRHLGLS